MKGPPLLALQITLDMKTPRSGGKLSLRDDIHNVLTDADLTDDLQRGLSTLQQSLSSVSTTIKLHRRVPSKRPELSLLRRHPAKQRERVSV